MIFSAAILIEGGLTRKQLILDIGYQNFLRIFGGTFAKKQFTMCAKISELFANCQNPNLTLSSSAFEKGRKLVETTVHL